MESINIKELNDRIQRESSFVDILTMEMNKVIVGQKQLVENLLIGLLANGHILLEGVPGLAKTLAINTLSNAVDSKFSRIQFTPDLLPADVIGTLIYSQKTEQFQIKKGPVFANFVLADEINRSPAKVQSALLEAMQERQVTIGDETFKLPEPFLVMATQNPIEQEGTYPLPEAQLDRFMLKVVVTYPKKEEERQIIHGGEHARIAAHAAQEARVFIMHHAHPCLAGFGVDFGDKRSLAERDSKPLSLTYGISDNTLMLTENITLNIHIVP
mgnify:CR=1 FL=1